MKKIVTLLFSVFALGSVQAQTEVTFFTTEGRFVVEIYDNKVPITGGNFLKLVDSNYYDGVIFHRVIDNFMIQGGDPTGTGSGGPGYTIQDEFDSSLSNVQKTISMANSGPNTGGSQFFINLVDNTYLDFDKPPTTSKHPVFGMVTENFSVVQAIGKVSTNSQNRPLVDVVMDSIRVGSLLYSGVDDAPKYFHNISIAPNPIENISSSYLHVNAIQSGNSLVTLFDSQGRMVQQSRLTLQKGFNQFPLGNVLAKDLSSGIYHLNFTFEGQRESKTIIVQ